MDPKYLEECHLSLEDGVLNSQDMRETSVNREKSQWEENSESYKAGAISPNVDVGQVYYPWVPFTAFSPEYQNNNYKFPAVSPMNPYFPQGKPSFVPQSPFQLSLFGEGDMYCIPSHGMGPPVFNHQTSNMLNFGDMHGMLPINNASWINEHVSLSGKEKDASNPDLVSKIWNDKNQNQRSHKLHKSKRRAFIVPEVNNPFDPCNLFVKNLDDQIFLNTKDLENLFTPFGEITSAHLATMPNPKFFGQSFISKGYGFVAFAKPTGAFEAKSCLNGCLIGSKRVFVSWAERRDDREKRLRALYIETHGLSSDYFEKLNNMHVAESESISGDGDKFDIEKRENHQNNVSHSISSKDSSQAGSTTQIDKPNPQETSISSTISFPIQRRENYVSLDKHNNVNVLLNSNGMNSKSRSSIFGVFTDSSGDSGDYSYIGTKSKAFHKKRSTLKERINFEDSGIKSRGEKHLKSQSINEGLISQRLEAYKLNYGQ